jgi:hypothetical protein
VPPRPGRPQPTPTRPGMTHGSARRARKCRTVSVAMRPPPGDQGHSSAPSVGAQHSFAVRLPLALGEACDSPADWTGERLAVG